MIEIRGFALKGKRKVKRRRRETHYEAGKKTRSLLEYIKT